MTGKSQEGLNLLMDLIRISGLIGSFKLFHLLHLDLKLTQSEN